MPKKRILHKLTLSEISAVDRPCQEGARMTLMKRAEDGDQVEELGERVVSLRKAAEDISVAAMLRRLEEVEDELEQLLAPQKKPRTGVKG